MVRVCDKYLTFTTSNDFQFSIMFAEHKAIMILNWPFICHCGMCLHVFITSFMLPPRDPHVTFITPPSRREEVKIDSTTMIPADLYWTMLRAGDRAKCLGRPETREQSKWQHYGNNHLCEAYLFLRCEQNAW